MMSIGLLALSLWIMKPATVRIFGGRDVGKTTIAMHTAAELRWMGIPTSLTYNTNTLWTEASCIVDMRIHEFLWTPNDAAELCEGSLNFLILRPRYYWDKPPDYAPPHSPYDHLEAQWTAADEKLETTLRAGHVEYKSLPGVRASTQYLIKKICDRVGYDK